MTEQEKTQLVRESLRFVRETIQNAIDTGDTSQLSGALYVVRLMDGTDVE
jgi:hypothetical protein